MDRADGPAAASPVILTLDDGSTGSDFDYSIPPRSSQRFTTSNPFGALNSGSVRAVPDSGNAAPSGLVVFSYAPAGKTLSEAGVPALPKGSAFRSYAEASGMPGQVGSISTGLAITNVGDASNTVTLEVTHLNGSLAAAPETLTLPPSGQVARFLYDQVFSLPDNFSGVSPGYLGRRYRDRCVKIKSQQEWRDQGDDAHSIEREGSFDLGGEILRASCRLGALVHTVYPVQRDGRAGFDRNTEFY